MDSEQLLALAVRVEQATGPGRELDALIAEVEGVRHRSRRTAGGKNKGRQWLVDSHGGVESWSNHPTAYTASLDAAMTLVPEGWRAARYLWLKRDGPHAWVLVHETITAREASAATPALALTAASLRALAASMKDETHVGN